MAASANEIDASANEIDASTIEIDASANEIIPSTIEIGTVIEGVGNRDPKDHESAVNLLKDYNLCYHPLVPIYMILSPFYYTLGPKYENYPFLYSYFTYFNVLEKMVDVINNNYLNDPLDGINIFAAYYIGRGLGTFLITSNTSIEQNDKILEIIGMTQQEYYTFSLTTASFANLFIGSVHSTPEEEKIGISFINTQLFKNFINEEVNIKGILQSEPTEGLSESSPTEGLPSYMKLKQKVRDLIHKIAVKVNADRGTPLDAEIDDANAAGIEIPDAIASGIEIPDDAENVKELNMEVGPPSEEIEIMDEKKLDNDDAENDAELNMAVGPPSEEIEIMDEKKLGYGNKFKRRVSSIPKRPVVPSGWNPYSRGAGVGGGKITKNRYRKKGYTRKQKRRSIRSVKKTRKHKRCRKHTRKNVN
jgi:hypothetical protein